MKGSEPIVPIKYRLDEHTEYWFGNKNGFKDSIFVHIDGLREPKNGHKAANERIDVYTMKSLKTFYADDQGDLKLDETEKFIISTKHSLIFIPLTNKKGNITDYAVTGLEHYEKIKNDSFYRSVDGMKKYVKRSKDHVRLHHIIFGRKPKKGGWEKMENFDITKIPKSSVWLSGIGEPLPYMGNKWNLYKDEKGDVYIKIPGHVIDHRNSDGLDNRFINLREVPFGTNRANKNKRKNTTSDYFGVHYDKGSKKWIGIVTYNEETYRRQFDLESNAAIFHDMYALALYGCVICNNGFLTEEQVSDLLKRREDAIPDEFKASKAKLRNLPKNIIKDGNKFKTYKKYKGKTYGKTYDTLEEAIKGLPELLEYVQNLKNEDEKKKLDSKRHNEKELFGYLECFDKHGKVSGVAKVDKVFWEKYAQVTWVLSGNKRLTGTLSDVRQEVHLHVFKETFNDYHASTHGTVDHVIQDTVTEDGIYFSDCTLANLRCANYSQQTQNRNTPSLFQYQGVSMDMGIFRASFNWKDEKPLRGKRRTYIEEAAKDYNDFALSKWSGAKINKIPETLTSVADLFHKSKLTTEKIEKFYLICEIKSCLYVNDDWAEACDVVNFKNIKMKHFEKYKNKIIKLFAEDQECEEYNSEDYDECDDFPEDGKSDEEQVESDDEEENSDEETDDSEKYDPRIVHNNKEESYEYKAYKIEEEVIDPETVYKKASNPVYGYERRFDPHKVYINEAEAKIIRYIFESALSRQKIADHLNSLNCTKRGKRWNVRGIAAVREQAYKYEGNVVDGFRYPKIIEIQRE